MIPHALDVGDQHALDVGDQHAGVSPAPPNRPGCVICQGETRDGSDWCPDHLAELRLDTQEDT